MGIIYWNNKKLEDLNHGELEQLLLLSPYWGLALDRKQNELFGGLKGLKIGIIGLSANQLNRLKMLLEHTEIQLTEKLQDDCDQRLFIEVIDQYPTPLAIRTADQKLIYIQPALQTELPIQRSIHKNINVKRKSGPITIFIPPKYESYLCEWNAYILIQSALRSEFRSLSNVDRKTYSLLVRRVLMKVNPYFAKLLTIPAIEEAAPMANRNKTEKQMNWPAFPPFDEFKTQPSTPPKSAKASSFEYSYSTKRSQSLVKNPTNDNPINPFKRHEANNKTSPISPFSRAPNKSTTVINPFLPRRYTQPRSQEYDNSTFNRRRDES
ncbi:hypothetical protein WD019_00730 [Fictibacillus sp. Mic-4]|uniref:hypothetical protein n=1 Tax=Fictibacillus TaxID=1329200 RepID=UPI000416895F|nr:hypothetical protein [Fictibacillus gelatini]